MTDMTTAAVLLTAAADIMRRIAAVQPLMRDHQTAAAGAAMAETLDTRPTGMITTAAAIANTKRQLVPNALRIAQCPTTVQKEAADQNVVMNR